MWGVGMGGIGSGRRSSRPTTDECIIISLADLKRRGMLKRHCLNRRELAWTCDGQAIARMTIVADVDCHGPYPCLKITGYAQGRRVDCIVSLDSHPLHLGGERWYALCPMTGRRCTELVLPPCGSRFASVQDWGVAYGSQRECEVHRAYRAIHVAEHRLKRLSKYARKPTRERLLTKIASRHMTVEYELDRLASMIR